MSSARRQIAKARLERRIRRRKRRPLIAGGAALTIALSLALSVASFGGVDLANAAAVRAQSFMELMSRRSPGTRTQALLTKHKRNHERVLADHNPTSIVIPAYTPDVGLVAPPLSVPIPGFSEPPILAAAAPPPPIFFGHPPGILLSTPPGAPPIIGFVPEPDTWTMMILGFGLSGWMLRRRRTGQISGSLQLQE